VPKTSSDRSFQNSKEWLDAAIKVAGTKHKGTYEAAYRISNHLLRFYRDSVLAACETQRIPVSKPMSATQFSSMMNASGVSGKGEQEIKKHLKAHLGPGFCPSRRCQFLSPRMCLQIMMQSGQIEILREQSRVFVKDLPPRCRNHGKGTSSRPGEHLGLFWRKKNIKFYFRTKRRTRKNTDVS
jgi:hypothetical protein